MAAVSERQKLCVNVLAIPGAGVGLEVSAYYGFGFVNVHSITLTDL
jgi:hypothetical protein